MLSLEIFGSPHLIGAFHTLCLALQCIHLVEQRTGDTLLVFRHSNLCATGYCQRIDPLTITTPSFHSADVNRTGRRSARPSWTWISCSIASFMEDGNGRLKSRISTTGRPSCRVTARIFGGMIIPVDASPIDFREGGC